MLLKSFQHLQFDISWKVSGDIVLLMCGRSEEFSVVNTDLNCSTIICAFSLLSLNRVRKWLAIFLLQSSLMTSLM